MIRLYSMVLAVLLYQNVNAQQPDTIQTLDEIKVKAYLSEQPLLSVPATAVSLNQIYLEQRNSNSLLPSLNSVSGVKMEERSPGSYRLSLRGSLLRSPFGVRNIKIYLDDFPLTDAGGNTYLNLLDQNAISKVEILKGPDGSLFGANSGGVLLLESLDAAKDQSEISLSGGSYGFFRENLNIQRSNQNHDFSVHQAYQRADGFRDHSGMKRFYLQTAHEWRYLPKASLKFSGFYSDLDYETPGGLTLSQFQERPKSARSGAQEKNVGIKNRTFFAGIRHQRQISSYFDHVIALSGMTTDFQNPFFTNAEDRDEQSVAARTYFQFHNKDTHFRIQLNLGGEFQYSKSDILNRIYRESQSDSLVEDRIKNQTSFLFSRLAIQAGEHFKAELSGSLNMAEFSYRNLQGGTAEDGKKTFKEQLMPRLAASYLFNQSLALRGIISKGYSLPGTAEVRASDARINTALDPEQGWNYELGWRWQSQNQRVYADLAAFYYRLDDAIVRRVNAADQDYFINAGGTDQKGIELQLNALLFQNLAPFKNLTLNSALTYSDFEFRDYTVANTNYSGNRLTGVPKWILVNALSFHTLERFGVFVQHTYNSKTSLNDASTIYADSYHLLQARVSWLQDLNRNKMKFSIGADNILNETYSLGNDLNAFGGRYFNAAPKTNYYASVSFLW